MFCSTQRFVVAELKVNAVVCIFLHGRINPTPHEDPLFLYFPLKRVIDSLLSDGGVDIVMKQEHVGPYK